MTKVSTDWKTLSSKILLENKYLQILEDEVLRPDGKISHYYYRSRDPFSIVIPLKKNIVSLVRQYRYTVKSLSWEFPMGYVAGKNPYDSAVTELKEETGMSADNIIEIGKFWVGVGSSNQSAHVYVAQDLKQGEATPEDGEFLELKEFTIADVGVMIDKGEILDGPTIVAYHYLEKYLKSI
ncbi:MAG TPA: NUDIX hydrolase [Candidatus Levybacteria bacterium]|nr:NUDIX hydrolase [Candidatus Levybacteria bacterium]